MATSRKKQNDDFLFASDEKTSRRKRVAAPTTPMTGGPSGPAMSGGPSGPAMSGTPGKVDAPKRRRRAVDENTLKQLYG